MPERFPGGAPTDIYVQLIISVALGLSSFIGFCFLRTRWSGLYAARQKSLGPQVELPPLPDTFFGWVPVVYRITEEQVLSTAGLDAFVFLAFFKQAAKFLTCSVFFGLTILTPVHKAFPEPPLPAGNGTRNGTAFLAGVYGEDRRIRTSWLDADGVSAQKRRFDYGEKDSYLWMYPIFVYLFSGLALYFLVQETIKIINVRQKYLGGQSTVTDRTVRLTGIPEDMRSEEKIKDFIEDLQIGKVDRVTLCRDWSTLDELIDERMRIVRRLEEAWTVHLGETRIERNRETLPNVQPSPPGPLPYQDEEDEESGLLNGNGEQARVRPYARDRPSINLRYGFLRLQSRQVDAIDHYEDKLKAMDDKIREARKQEYKPVSLAFVTLDSVAACQMAIQAKLDPSPLTLLAGPAPAPPDVIWPSTYESRRLRMLRAWTITVLITILTIFFFVVTTPLAGLVSLEAIKRVMPQFGDFLQTHYITRNLVQSTLPAIILSLLNVAVPYIFDWLSTYQGYIAGGDIEISSIAKNYLFVYFNSFLIFTIVGSGLQLYQDFKKALLDTSYILHQLGSSLSKMAKYYSNYIILQGIGLAPFRALEVGAIFCYPIGLIGAKTPRDYAELLQPPLYKYSLTIPQSILIYNLAIIYSVLRSGTTVMFFALLYFLLGHFFLKYQLLYAMESPSHSTGKAWPMIASRVIFSIIVFQLAMAGVLVSRPAYDIAALLFPLIPFTIGFLVWFRRSYDPLMRYIALRAIERDENGEIRAGALTGGGEGDEAERRRRQRVSMLVPEDYSARDPHQGFAQEAHDENETLAEHMEHGMAYANPSLVAPLPRVWIGGRDERSRGGTRTGSEDGDDAEERGTQSNSGSIGGDNNVWSRS